jgi:Ca2+-transporting ATPase
LAEVEQRRGQWGLNQIQETNHHGPWQILWQQFTNLTMLVLLAAAAISALLGDTKDMLAILAIVLLSALLGFNQEYRAAKAIAALKKLAVPKVKVCRSGQWQEISAQELVPGDILRLETGSSVPADGRLLESVNLQVQEATFTGESVPVEKTAATLPKAQLPLSEQQNMVWMGTTVAYGRGQVVVTATGMKTELGNVANLLQTVATVQTPLQRRLDQLGQKLAIAALVIVALIFALGVLRGEPLKLLILTAISIAVAAIPEGLPAVVTIALALGAQRMLQQRALIRHLPAVETLGSVTTICSDKTGTLTENRMTVTMLAVPVYNPQGEPSWLKQSLSPSLTPALECLLTGAALCNDAILQSGEQGSGFKVLGDPTEVALVVAAAHAGLEKTFLEQQLPRVQEVPFASERQRMTTLHGLTQPSSLAGLAPFLALTVEPTSFIAFSKGALGSILTVSNQIWVGERLEPLLPQWREEIIAAHNQWADSGLRVLGVACRSWVTQPDPKLTTVAMEQDLVFLGLIAITDPPRPEVGAAVRTCKQAGIRPMLITGDHPLMAKTIAQELGITTSERVVTGTELETLSPEALSSLVKEVSVYARILPQQKLLIVESLQAQGEIVAMTGDGINDAPALRRADVGVAMGIAGTDVAKEAADIVLLDDNFATIVLAVREGRTIYANIRKFILYLLSGNSAEIWVMVLAPFLGMPLPLLPLQILWINLLTDGLPALALGLEPAEQDTMSRPPRPLREDFFAGGMARRIIWVGLLIAVATLSMGYIYWSKGRPQWQTLLFTILTFTQLANALAMRSERLLLWQLGWFSNKPLLGAIGLTFGLHLCVIYLPVFQEIFQTQALAFPDLLVTLFCSIIVFASVELQKWAANR